MHRWASTLLPVEEDKYGILPVLPTLALAYSRVRKAPNNRSKEHIQRRSIDEIIELALVRGLIVIVNSGEFLPSLFAYTYLLQPCH